LLRKRAGEVAGAWPKLAAAFGLQWTRRFAEWAAGRPPPVRDATGSTSLDRFAASGELPELAAEDLAEMSARWLYDGSAPPRRRRFPALYRLRPRGCAERPVRGAPSARRVSTAR
jgi:hypothetical protein